MPTFEDLWIRKNMRATLEEHSYAVGIQPFLAPDPLRIWFCPLQINNVGSPTIWPLESVSVSGTGFLISRSYGWGSFTPGEGVLPFSTSWWCTVPIIQPIRVYQNRLIKPLDQLMEEFLTWQESFRKGDNDGTIPESDSAD